VILGAGAAHGLTAGSTWTVHPAATKKVTANTPLLGRARVSVTRAVTAAATILEESSPGVIAAGCRAVEEHHDFGSMRLRVEVVGKSKGKDVLAVLRRKIGGSSLLRLERPEDGARTAVRVYLVAPRTQVREHDVVPQLGAVERPLLVALGRDDEPCGRPEPVDRAGAVDRVIAALEERARFRHALELDPPRSTLRGRLEVILKRRSADGRWRIAEPCGHGEVRFKDGDLLGLAVTNNHSQRLFLSVLDFGLTGRVSLVHPIAGACEPLMPGRVLEIGTRPGDERRLFVPPDFPLVGGRLDGTVPAGCVEYLKVFATTQEADFSQLTQTRSATARRGRMETLLNLALHGHGLREAPPNEMATEDWTTVTRAFFLARRSGQIVKGRP